MEEKSTDCTIQVRGESGGFLKRRFTYLIENDCIRRVMDLRKKRASQNLCSQLLCSERITLQGSEACIIPQRSCTVCNDSISNLETSDAGASLDNSSRKAHCFPG